MASEVRDSMEMVIVDMRIRPVIEKYILMEMLGDFLERVAPGAKYVRL
jgi:hypothetical protein